MRRQKCTEESSGEIQWKAPTPEGEDTIQSKKGSRALVKPEGGHLLQPEVRKVSSMEENKGLNRKLYKSGGHWFGNFLWNPNLLKGYVLRGKPSSNSYLTGETCENVKTAPTSESAHFILAWRS